MSHLQPDTIEIQSKFASFCRTGEEHELPGITENRLDHYRRLIVNILEDNLESAFPIAFEYLPIEKWELMVDSFIRNHDCQSYQNWKISGEFYEFAQEQNFSETLELPFLNDLLRLEWEEMYLYNMPDLEVEAFTPANDLLNHPLVINPEFRLLPMNFPLHLMNPNQALEKSGDYYVLLYREKDSGAIQFVDLSVWFALVIEQLATGTITLHNLLLEAKNFFGEIDIEELKDSTLNFLNELKTGGFVLGMKSP